jgi:hypothetical protein
MLLTIGIVYNMFILLICLQPYQARVCVHENVVKWEQELHEGSDKSWLNITDHIIKILNRINGWRWQIYKSFITKGTSLAVKDWITLKNSYNELRKIYVVFTRLIKKNLI